MADTTKAAAKAAKAPTSADIERAREFAREPFLLEGEKPKDLSPGTPRRRALDAALAEIDEGLEAPSIEWRRDFSLMLGLERVLSEEKPQLADGAELDPHQVDALSGTLAALITDVQERVNGTPWTGNGNAAAAVAEAEEETEDEGEGRDADEPAENGEAEDLEEDEATEAEEAEDWEERGRGRRRGGAGGPGRKPPLLVRARHRRRQDRRRGRLHRGLAHRRHPDPHPPPQPGRPVHRRDL